MDTATVKKILFITLSNIGDVILTLPVLDVLRASFSESEITCLVGPRPKEVFENNPYIRRIIVYDKHARLREKIKLFRKLKDEKFDLVADLRNSLFGVFIPARHKTSPFRFIPKNIRHMKDRHLYKIKNQIAEIKNGNLNIEKKSLPINFEDAGYIEDTLRANNINQQDKIIVIASGARSHIKRWDKDKFVALISALMKEFKARIILVGDKEDILTNKYIAEHLRSPVVDLSGKTTLLQLACLLKKAEAILTNDSAVLHIASYFDKPVVALFGPTDDAKYGPWSKTFAVVKKEIFCRPCQKAQCRFGSLECMTLIGVGDVLRKVRDILVPDQVCGTRSHKDEFKRILIVRTDRIGDVLLSTPVIKALRDAYPNAYIAMMVSPYAVDIVDGNPDLDKVIIYDKDRKHKGWYRSLKFAFRLKKRRFDLAIILHPTNRVHLVTFFAGIARRIGYHRKLGFLLTERIKHTKQQGLKHELEYNLDFIRYLNIEPKDKSLFMPLKAESESWVRELFRREGIKENDQILAIHPGASCPSKIWPSERFAEVVDRLREKYGFKILVVAGPKDLKLAQAVIKHMDSPVINLAARTSVSQLASVLKRCRLFISNDSGPVHISSAVGTPVISIFGRNQKGLSPKRWGPIGKGGRVLHKEVGCIECLAHNCTKEFACLKAITVDDVINAADSILEG